MGPSLPVENPRVGFVLKPPYAILCLSLLVIATNLLPISDKSPVQRHSNSTDGNSSTATQGRSLPRITGTPPLYVAVIPTCQELGNQVVEERFIHHWLRFERPTGFARTCTETRPNDLEFEREITMSVEEFQTEEKAQKFLETIRDWPDTERLRNPWVPNPRINVDDYVTWELHGIGQPNLKVPRITQFSEYTVAVRKEQFVFYVGFIELDSNDPYLGRIPGVMGSILKRWDDQIDSSVNSHRAYFPAPGLIQTPRRLF